MRFAVTSEISADHDKLEQDHADAAAHYFHNAVRILTDEFGEEYARRNPAVIAAMIAASATEVFGYRYKFAAQDLRDALRDLAAGYQGGEA